MRGLGLSSTRPSVRLTRAVDCTTIHYGREGREMTSNLHALALSLDQAAPDLKIATLIQQERQKIEEALATVGEYVLSDDEGRVYVITATADKNTESVAAATASA